MCLELQTIVAALAERIGRPHVRSWVRPDGARIVLTATVVKHEGNVSESIGKYELFKDGRLLETELDDFPIRFYEPDEFCRLLTTAGFDSVRVTKAYTDEPPSPDEWLLSFRAKRRA